MYGCIFYLYTNEAKIIPSHMFYIIRFMHILGPLKKRK